MLQKLLMVISVLLLRNIGRPTASAYAFGAQARVSFERALTSFPVGAHHWRCFEECWQLFLEGPFSHLPFQHSAVRSWDSAAGMEPGASEHPCWHSAAICYYSGRETCTHRKHLHSSCIPSLACGRFLSNSCQKEEGAEKQYGLVVLVETHSFPLIVLKPLLILGPCNFPFITKDQKNHMRTFLSSVPTVQTNRSSLQKSTEQVSWEMGS